MVLNEIKTYTFKKQKSSFLITAPHDSTHESNGKTMLKVNCPTHKNQYRDHDPNTGILARHIAENLDSELLIITNAKKDYNKDVDDFYIKYVNKVSPRFLIEIHSHEEKHTSDIEVSMGKDKTVMAFVFAELMNGLFFDFGDYETVVDGDYDSIFYKASKTASVNGNGYNYDETHNTIHIEIPQSLIDKHYLEDECIKLSLIISDTIRKFINKLNDIEL